VTLSSEESDWGEGRNAYVWANVDLLSNQSSTALIRFGKGTILASEVYATYQQAVTSPLVVTYGWTEAGIQKRHSHVIPADQLSDTWTVPTGQQISKQWVRFEAR
jgi:hypothetical protein